MKATVPNLLRLLAHNVRWELLTELSRSDRRVGELVDLTARPQNLISYHLRRLRLGGIVHERRSNADARDVYYHLDLDRLGELYHQSGGALHPALSCRPTEGAPLQPGRSVSVLFLCTHNSARSQMAEALWRAGAGPTVTVASAGSEPSVIHPLAVRAMAEHGIDISDQRSKHMNEFAGQHFDAIITVCDRVREVCPVFPDDPQQIHWSIRDPSAVPGTEEAQLEAFRATVRELLARISHLRPALERHHS